MFKTYKELKLAPLFKAINQMKQSSLALVVETSFFISVEAVNFFGTNRMLWHGSAYREINLIIKEFMCFFFKEYLQLWNLLLDIIVNLHKV